MEPIFAQLPPSYSPEYGEDLTAFLEALPCQQIPLALEVRHPDWFKPPDAPQLELTLKKFAVGQVLLDTRPIYCSNDSTIKAQNRKPKLPLQPRITADYTIVRFISHPQPEFNQPWLEEWVERVECWLHQGTQIYFFVHCPVEERSPHTARSFQQLLEKRGVEVPPLPWNQLNSFGEQLRLF